MESDIEAALGLEGVTHYHSMNCSRKNAPPGWASASAALLLAARQSSLTMIATVALALEYEAVCRTTEHRIAAGLSPNEVDVFIDAVLAMVEPVKPHFLWRPQLRDPADELVLEAAINGRAAALATFNRRDFGKAPARLGIEVLTPGETLRA